MPAIAEAAARPSLLRNRSHRLPTFGVILVITVAAVEAMSVATVMPTAVRSLHGLHYYGWAFTAFFLGDIVGMVDAGRRCDRLGPGASEQPQRPLVREDKAEEGREQGGLAGAVGTEQAVDGAI